MPWMLLNEPSRERDAHGDAGSDAGIGSQRSSVWILIGGLDRAMLQAGIMSRLLETGPPPSALIASGFGLVNALLVSGGRRHGFERRWEQLRASRFLPSAAIGNVRLLGTRNGVFDELSALLAEIAHAKIVRAGDGPQILTATEDGFSSLPDDGTSSLWRAAIKQSLRYTSESPPLIAGAIREAATRGRQVLVLALDRTIQTHPDVVAAIRSVRAEGAEVSFVTAAAVRKPGLLDYLLPGSGAPERLMREGRSAAERWLLAAGGNGSKRPGHVPFSGSGVGGAAGLSEPDEGGLWTRDASDASNWPK